MPRTQSFVRGRLWLAKAGKIASVVSHMTTRRLLALASLLAGAVSAPAALIPITSYTYGTSPSGTYPDSGGVELRDGVTASAAWGAGPIGFADVVALVGWQNTNPTVTFNFGSPVTIRSFTAWGADSDGAAGVALPSALTLTTVGFNQSFTVVNPAGAGTTVALSHGGFEVTTSSITLVATRSTQWTMFSEVQFFDTVIPEPSTYAAIAGVAALGLAAFRRRRS